ncbi:hypothetical protein NDU88_005529 [Pleurodeles waltl]|uniref:Uncharacterized protein n=1 Tax=Pleurodeles waltl TaxID=8319 RepID=A0AAV7MX26_PLEWA|nr:hypothetical protein NDU88_005529 [Pleurodeles waltl]
MAYLWAWVAWRAWAAEGLHCGVPTALSCLRLGLHCSWAETGAAGVCWGRQIRPKGSALSERGSGCLFLGLMGGLRSYGRPLQLRHPCGSGQPGAGDGAGHNSQGGRPGVWWPHAGWERQKTVATRYGILTAGQMSGAFMMAIPRPRVCSSTQALTVLVPAYNRYGARRINEPKEDGQADKRDLYSDLREVRHWALDEVGEGCIARA